MTPPDLIFGFDFYSFWAAANVFLSGKSPYNNDLLQAAQLSAGWPKDSELHIFPYPPWALLFFTPFALLPFELAKVAWTIFSLSTMIHGAIIVNRFVAKEFKTDLLQFPSLLISLIMFPPTLREVLLGQTAHLTFYGVALSLHFRDQSLISGLLLAITSLKPQQFAPFYFLVFARDIMCLQYKRLFGFCIGATSLLAFISLLQFDILSEYLVYLADNRDILRGFGVVTIPKVIEDSIGIVGFREYFFFVVLIVFGLVGTFKKPSSRSMYTVGLSITMLLTPYNWLHDCLILFPSLLLGINFISVRILYLAFWLVSVHANLNIYPELLTPLLALLTLGVSMMSMRNARNCEFEKFY